MRREERRYDVSHYIEFEGYRALHKISEQEFEKEVDKCKKEGIPFVVSNQYHRGEIVAKFLLVEEI